MPSSNEILLTIVLCGLVTWLSRVIPFVLLKYVKLSKGVIEFLSFVPIVIMTTLWFSNLFTVNTGHLPTLNLAYAIATLPMFLVAVITKNLLAIVAIGIVSLAVLRAMGMA